MPSLKRSQSICGNKREGVEKGISGSSTRPEHLMDGGASTIIPFFFFLNVLKCVFIFERQGERETEKERERDGV